MTPRPRNATFAIVSDPRVRCGGSRERGGERQTAERLSGVERDVPGPDPVVGAVRHDLVDRPVEARLEGGVLRAQPDPVAVVGLRLGWDVAHEAAAGALAAGEEARQRQLVADDEVEALGEEVEIGLLELAVGSQLRAPVAPLDEGRGPAAVARADAQAGEGLRRDG